MERLLFTREAKLVSYIGGSTAEWRHKRNLEQLEIWLRILKNYQEMREQ